MPVTVRVVVESESDAAAAVTVATQVRRGGSAGVLVSAAGVLRGLMEVEGAQKAIEGGVGGVFMGRELHAEASRDWWGCQEALCSFLDIRPWVCPQ